MQKRIIYDKDTFKPTEIKWIVYSKEHKLAMEFHVLVRPNDKEYVPYDDFVIWNDYLITPFGIESHRTEPSYKSQTPIDACTVLGTKCYCDGTSLGAYSLFMMIKYTRDWLNDPEIDKLIFDYLTNRYINSKESLD